MSGRFGRVALALLAVLAAGPAHAHDVKDPVCRMNTDSDTTPYREAVGGKTYYFCSGGCKARFDKSPASYLTLAQRLAHGGQTYRLVLDAPPHPMPGRATPLSFVIREMPSGQVVRDFEIVHEKRLHFLIVSQDMTYFEHQHPTLDADGRFRIAWAFPRAGRYLLFADFTPTDGDNQILRTTLDVGGPIHQTPKPPALTPETEQIKIVGDTRVQLVRRPLPGRRAGRPCSPTR